MRERVRERVCTLATLGWGASFQEKSERSVRGAWGWTSPTWEENQAEEAQLRQTDEFWERKENTLQDCSCVRIAPVIKADPEAGAVLFLRQSQNCCTGWCGPVSSTPSVSLYVRWTHCAATQIPSLAQFLSPADAEMTRLIISGMERVSPVPYSRSV